MNKQAYEASLKHVMRKKAGLKADYIASILPFSGSSSTAMAIKASPEELAQMNADESYNSFIPGAAKHRITRRILDTDASYGSEHPRARSIARNTGSLAMPLVLAAIGAGTGAYLASKNKLPGKTGIIPGAVLGGLSGATVSAAASVMGAVAAGLTKTRTDEEQQAASTSSPLWYAIPGYAAYDRFKTLGKSREVDENKLKKLRKK